MSFCSSLYEQRNIEYIKLKFKRGEKMKRRNKLLLGILVGTILAPNIVNAQYAYSVGTEYASPDSPVDTTSLTKQSSEAFYAMGYNSYYNLKPTISYMKGNNPGGYKRMESEVVFLSGHANEVSIYFNYLHQGGEYETGVCTSCTLSNYFALSSSNFPYTKLMIFNACNTGQGNSNNLMTYAVSRGVDSTIGWSTEVTQLSASSWFDKFYNYLSQRKSVKEAYDYAQSGWYIDSRIKNARLWGSWETILIPGSGGFSLNPLESKKKFATIENPNRNEYKVNYNLENKASMFQRENSDSANDILTSIERYIREEIDENFDQDNYILEITDSFDKSYYMFSKKVDGAKSNEYFQVVLDKKNNMIIEYHESLNKVQEMYSSNPYNNEVIELAKKEAARIYKDEILKQSEITIYNTKDDTYHLYIVSDLKDANDNLYSEFYEYIMPN